MHEVSVVSKRVGLTVGSSSKQGVLAVELGHVESMVEYIYRKGRRVTTEFKFVTFEGERRHSS